MQASLKGYNDKFLRTVATTVTAYKMFKPHDSVLVGVSGGPDSVALVHTLYTLSTTFSIRLGIAHLNHGLRPPDSDKEAEFVESLACGLDLPFYTRKVDVRTYQREHKLSPEEAARDVRYTFLNDVAAESGFDKIALGHHGDDNAEQVLMNLLRGSGSVGLSGMPAKRDERIVRPLFKAKRSDIIEYLRKNHLKYLHDSSNQDEIFLRNRIRHDLIPRLKAGYNPKIVETLNRVALIIGAEDEWMDQAIQPIFDHAVLARGKDNLTLSVSRLADMHAAVQRRIIRKAVKSIKGNLRRVTFRHIDSVIRLMTQGSGDGKLDLPDRVRIERSGDDFLLSRKSRALRNFDPESGEDIAVRFEYHMDGPGAFDVKEIKAQIRITRWLEFKPSDFSPYGRPDGHPAAFFDMERIEFPLVLRNYRPGDRFTPLGMSGTQKVKKYFINQKVPRSQRMGCPILLSRGKIIWVVGHRIDDSVKIAASTRNVLKVEVLLA